MRSRFYILAAAAVAVALTSCSDDGGTSIFQPADTTAPAATTAQSTATTTTTAPVDGPLAPPQDPADLLAPDLGATLAALGFPPGWVVPEGGADDVVGVLARASRGEDVTYTTYRTAYTVPAGDPEQVAEEWAGKTAEAIGVDGMERLGTITSDSSLEVSWKVIGDPAPGAPTLEVSAIQTDDNPEVLVVIEYQTVDKPFPEVVLPATIDPDLPALDVCEASRFDVNLDAFDVPNDVVDPPNYKLWWEGNCPAATFDAAVAWARAHGEEMPDGLTSFTEQVDDGNGGTIEVSASQLDDGSTFLTVIVERPVTLG